MNRQDHRREDRLPTLPCTPSLQTSMLPVGEQFVLWALRQWESEVALWNAKQTLPAGGSVLQRGFDLAGLHAALSPFAMVMDAIVCGMARPLEIHPLSTPIMSTDEGMLVALCGLAQDGLDEPLRACFAALLPPENCRVATIQLKLFALLLREAGLGSSVAAGGETGRLQ